MTTGPTTPSPTPLHAASDRRDHRPELIVLTILLAMLTAGFGLVLAGADRHAVGRSPHFSDVAFTLDLNSASAADLELLPRIGASLAERIVEHRETHGPFRSLRDLDGVRGIGPRLVELMEPYAHVADPTASIPTSDPR